MQQQEGRRAAGWRAVAWVLLAAAASAPTHAADCPDLDGHYRVAGFGPVLGDALGALGIGLAGFRDSEVKITGGDRDELRLWVKSGASGPMAAQPSRVLSRGVDFDCAAGVLTLRNRVAASRKTDTAYLEGRSTVSLRREGGGLALSAEFSGRERTTLFSYDSARVSVPTLGTGQTVRESIRWPGIEEPLPEAPRAAPPETAVVQAARRQLEGALGGIARLGGVADSGGRARATLSAARSEDMVAIEDRLRAAGVAYTVTRPPVWSNNQYSMELLVGAAAPGSAAAPGWHPSVFRVQQEIERMQDPMVSVRRVTAAEADYVAELDVLDGKSVDAILQRLRANAPLLHDIAVLDDTPDAAHPNLRRVRLRLRVE